MKDIRDDIFKEIFDKKFKATLTVEANGTISGCSYAIEEAKDIGIELKLNFSDGDKVFKGDIIGEVVAEPKKIAIAEERIIGTLAKYSGIATAAKKAVDESNGKVKIVAGSWKKMPPQMKDGVRYAVSCGGASFRITDGPMIYMDKNFIKMLGSITNALEAVREKKDFVKVIQIKGKDFSVEEEALMALENGCGILMVDTGEIDDLKRSIEKVNQLGLRSKVEIAFAGNVKIDDIKNYIDMDIDILCIGKEIVDAQLLDIKLDVIGRI
jgi:nicotinate-nucleotide pyrophosphorylase (carboxylating)